MVLMENCKCFFKKEKNTVVLRAYFLLGGLHCPPGYKPGFIRVNYEPGLISVNFDSIVDQW